MELFVEKTAPVWESSRLAQLFLGQQSILPSMCFRLQKHVELKGGLRSRAVAQRWVIDYVVKEGCFAELVKQREYIQRLPPRFGALFPTIFLLEPVEGSDRGVLVMERLEGESLHDFVLNPARSLRAKQQALRSVLTQLSELHRYPCGHAMVQRDPAKWSQRILARVEKANLSPALLGNIHRYLHVLGRKTLRPQIAPCFIHGDAQAGNFIIGDANGLSARWIDPLGGSSAGVGDYVYDLSRMYHWLDCAAQCFERERASRSVQHSKEKEFLTLQDLLHSSLLSHVRISADSFRDQMAHFWFYLYSAFHVSGKLSDFRSPASQRTLSRRLLVYLERALVHRLGGTRRTVSRSRPFSRLVGM